MDCPACGSPNEDDARFCGSCGTTLGQVEQAAAELLPQSADEPGRLPDLRPAEVWKRGSVPATAGPGVPTSGMAVASLVLGIGGLTFLPLLGSIVAVILGSRARGDIRRRPDEVTGDGVALVGVVLGWIGIGLTVLGLLLFGAITVCTVAGLGTS